MKDLATVTYGICLPKAGSPSPLLFLLLQQLGRRGQQGHRGQPGTDGHGLECLLEATDLVEQTLNYDTREVSNGHFPNTQQ